MAAELKAGDWCLFEHRLCSGDRALEVWLGKAVAIEDWGGKPSKKTNTAKGKRKTINGNRYDHGEYMIAIQWHERVAADSDQLEFEVGAPDISIQIAPRCGSQASNLKRYSTLLSQAAAVHQQRGVFLWTTCKRRWTAANLI